MQEAKLRITLADLQQLERAGGEGIQIEVVNGEIIQSERDMTFLHLIIIQNLFRIFDPFVRANKLGTVYVDGARYILTGATENIRFARIPDFSFLRAGRIPKDFDWSGDFEGAPDLAVEVVSPGQTNTVLLPKISEYLQAGTEEVWLIYPWLKTLHQYRADAETPVTYGADDMVDMSALFPGLTLKLADLFVTEVE